MTNETKNIIATLLTDTDADNRRIAAEQLAGSNEQATITALIIALSDDSNGVRDAATRSLISIGGPTVARGIAFHLADQDIVLRNLAAKILAKLGDSAITALFPFLRDPDKDVRKFAVDILGLIGTDQSLPQLLPLLKDEDENVRVATVEALGCIGSGEATLPLCEMFTSDKSPRIYLADAMRKIGDTRSGRVLLEAFLDLVGTPDPDSLVLYAITEALGVVGGRDAYNELLAHIPDVHGQMRSIGLHALIQIAERNRITLEFNASLREDLLQAFLENDVTIKMNIAKGLIQFGDREVTKAFVQALGKSDELDFYLFLELANRPETFGVCVEVLENPDVKFEKEIILLLGKLASDYVRQFVLHAEYPVSRELLDRLFDAIAKQWTSVDQETREMIVEAIFRIDSDHAVSFLNRVTNNADPWIHIQIIDQLISIPSRNALEFVVQSLENKDEQIREAAMMAMNAASNQVQE